MTPLRRTSIASMAATISAAAFFGTILCPAAPALAQSTTSKMDGMKLSSDEPIEIESDQLEVRDAERKAYFTGNVKVVQGTTLLKAGKMTVLYAGEGTSMNSGSADIEKIFVNNTVFLSSGTQQATADEGEFDMAAQTFILSGKQVVLSEGKNVFTGCKLTVFMTSGEAKLESCGGPVRILLDPKSQKKQ